MPPPDIDPYALRQEYLASPLPLVAFVRSRFPRATPQQSGTLFHAMLDACAAANPHVALGQLKAAVRDYYSSHTPPEPPPMLVPATTSTPAKGILAEFQAARGPSSPTAHALACELADTQVRLNAASARANMASERATAAESALARAMTPPPAPPAPAPTVHPQHISLIPSPTRSWCPTPLDPYIASLFSMRVPLLLVGPPGAGKSSAPREAAARAGLPFLLIPCNDATDAESCVQRRGLQNASTTCEDGPLAVAARWGYVACLDELGAMPPAAQAILHDYLAGGALHLPWSGEALPGRSAWITATSNAVASDRTDTTHEQQPSAALLDRFAILECPHLPQDQEAALLAAMAGFPHYGRPAARPTETPAPTPLPDSAPMPDAPTRIAGLLASLRAAYAQGDVSGCYSPRRGASLLSLLQAWGGTPQGQIMAVRASILDRHPPSQRALVAGLVQRHLAIEVPA